MCIYPVCVHSLYAQITFRTFLRVNTLGRYATLHYLALPCPALPYLGLPWPTLPYLAIAEGPELKEFRLLGVILTWPELLKSEN